MPKLATSASAHDLPMRLNQNNNANPQMIDSSNWSSNSNKSNPIVDNHRNSFYPKMNFTSSIVTTASNTLPNKMMPGNVPMVLDADGNKTGKHVDTSTAQTDQCAMMQNHVQNMATQNYHLTNSFSTGAMTSLHPLNNCTFNSIIQPNGHVSQQQQQQQRTQFQHQPPPPLLLQPASTTLTYSSNSIAAAQTQIQTSNGQATQQMQSPQQQNLGTKVTRHIQSTPKFDDFSFCFLPRLFASVVLH